MVGASLEHETLRLRRLSLRRDISRAVFLVLPDRAVPVGVYSLGLRLALFGPLQGREGKSLNFGCGLARKGGGV